jgi:hypothetical protein
MGGAGGPGKLYLAWIREHADDSRWDGEPGVVRPLEGVYADAAGGRTAGDCTRGTFSRLGREQLFHRKQSSGGWRIHRVVKGGDTRLVWGELGTEYEDDED